MLENSERFEFSSSSYHSKPKEPDYLRQTGDTDNDNIVPEEDEEAEDNEEGVARQEKWTLEELSKNFRRVYNERLHYTKTGFLKPSSYEDFQKREREMAFHPQINPVSELLSSLNASKMDQLIKRDQSFQNQSVSHSYQNPDESGARHNESASTVQENKSQAHSHVQRLYKRKQITEEKQREKEESKKMEEMEKCTFAPNTSLTKKVNEALTRNRGDRNQHFINRLYVPTKAQELEELKRKAQELREQMELEECSFHPQTNPFPGYSTNISR